VELVSTKKKYSDIEILNIIRRLLDRNKMTEIGITEERLSSFFVNVEQLLATRSDKALPFDLIIQIDGASRGNPGPAGIGVVVSEAGGAVIREVREFIGTTTNNVAEYRSLLRGMELAVDIGAKSVLFRTDSELMANQIRGKYKVKNKALISLYDLAKERMARFQKVDIEHVGRSNNKRADILANIAIDSAMKK
jgi:ribonuclease HI